MRALHAQYCGFPGLWGVNESFIVEKWHDQIELHKYHSIGCEDRLESSTLAVGEMRACCWPNSISFIVKVRGGEEKREGGSERYLGGPGDSFQGY